MKRPLCIAAIAPCPFPVNHGTPASIREIIQVQAKKGHEVHVITYPLQDKIPLYPGLILHRVRMVGGSQRIVVGPTAQRPLFDLQMVWKLCQVIKKYRVDVIHGYNYEGGIIGYVGKKWTGKPLVYTQLNSMIDELPSYDFIRPKFLAVGLAKALDYMVPRMADHVIPIAEELVDFLLEKGIDPKKMTLIRMGIDPTMFQNKDPELMRRKYNLGRRPVIIYTGLLNEFQRIDYLIQAMKVVVSEFPQALLLMVGNYIDEAQLAKYRTMAGELGVLENILFTDERPLEEIPYFLAAADVAVVSRPDCPGVPIKMLNYMAAGNAIVCPLGSSKGLKNMYDAIVVKDHSAEEIGWGIVKLLKDPELRRRLGENARKTVDELFSLNAITEKIDEVYEKVLQRSEVRN
jgi:glycosyltransferase involved in cell wall biosynthesis